MTCSFIIHMPASTERRPLVEALVEALPEAQVIDAVVGRDLPDHERTAATGENLFTPHFPFGLQAGELGCFLSHRKVWQLLVDSDHPFAVISEDDIAADEGFDEVLALALSEATKDSLIRFPIKNREVPQKIIAQSGQICLFRPAVLGLTTGMYIIGRDAAARLLERSQKIDRPIDVWLQMRWLTGVDSLTLWPSHIRSAASEHGGSSIQSRKSRLSQIKRSWHRMRYRNAIKKLSIST